jgi:hypothetical protein
MKTSANILLAFLCLGPCWQSGGATIRQVPSPQYPTIQAAVDASVNGDTVLVNEGTYYENIRYRGKAIVVSSSYLIDGDTTHIERTIINGSNPSSPDSASVVYFVNGEDTSSVLCGFTITGGKGTMWFDVPDGGLWFREGAGIFCESGGARIVRNVITRNRIQGSTADGAGVWVVNTTSSLPYLILERNLIADNTAQADSVGVFVGAGGAAIFSTSARIIANVFERDTAISRDGASGAGISFQGWPQGPYPVGLIQGNIFRDNVASTILRGAFGGGMVVEHTGPVTISDNLFEGNIAKSSSNLGRGGGLWIGDRYLPRTTAPARKLIVRNRLLRNRAQGTNWGSGGGIELDATLAAIAQNEIAENTATGTYGSGGGIWVYGSSCRVENNIIVRNRATDGGGVQFDSLPMPLRGTDQTVINNTIVDNHATSGGGLSVTEGAKIVMLNNILWADTAQNGKEIYVSGGTANVQYCNIQGGWPSGTCNIDSDPLFVGGDSVLDLMAGSPCIGKGIDSVQIASVWYHAPTVDYDGHSRHMPAGPQPCDIGAQEEQFTTDVHEARSSVPTQFALEQNYPNPFNPSTRINYTVVVTGGSGLGTRVKLAIYDLLGRDVAVLVDEKKAPGSYEVTFNAEELSSGVYFYRLEAGSFVETKKMVVLK